jgi:hypothetical protein
VLGRLSEVVGETRQSGQLPMGARNVAACLGTATQLHALVPARFALLVAALLVFVNVAPNTWQIKLKPRVWQGMTAGVAAAIAVMTISQPHPFIYFQF